jgi:hypothetical protein
MDPNTIDTLAERCLEDAGLPRPWRREPLRVWVMSGIERVHLPDGTTVMFKYANGPFTKEAAVLAHVANHGVPVPRLLGSASSGDLAAMVLEDLGEPIREATVADAAVAAVATHHVPPPPQASHVDATTLATLPASCLARITELAEADRWPDPTQDMAQLEELADVADTRAAGADAPPLGLCHGEFNPTSLHIGAKGWRLLDWAGPLDGPGLLDLAGWQYTTETPDLVAFDALLDAYVDAGGPDAAKTCRGGLPPARWAFGWHRLCIIDWYLQQATTWIADPTMDATYQQVIRRHLAEARQCLNGTS